jgi:hypothetical protein
MNTWVEPPPPPKPTGCFAKGCLILVVFGIVLAIACGAGIYWGLRYHSAVVRGMYWLTRTHAITNVPAPIPPYQTTDEKINATLERWRNFETDVRAGQPAEIELAAGDINDLIASHRDTRGKIFASIEGDRLRLQVSLPLGEIAGRSGYYLNGDIAIQPEGRESLVNSQLNHITINNQQLPPDVLDWKYRSRPLRDYLEGSGNPWNATTFEVRDGNVILKSRTDH